MSPAAPHTTCSPNLLELRDHILVTWGGQSLGCYNPRPIRGGTQWSSHAFGAALDWGYGTRHKGPGRKVMHDEVLPWLIHHADLLGVQQIHDYGGNRYWSNYRGWVMRTPGQGPDDALHIETTEAAWGNNTPIGARLKPATAASLNKPPRTLRRGATGLEVKRLQTELATHGFYLLNIDGKFGPRTEEAVKAYQAANGLTVDGVFGPKTRTKLYG
jgi:hypothetical protein